MLERTLLYYKENANARERLGDMIDRIGVEKVRQDLLAGDVLSLPVKKSLQNKRLTAYPYW